jgi:hypothetical protein
MGIRVREVRLAIGKFLHLIDILPLPQYETSLLTQRLLQTTVALPMDGAVQAKPTVVQAVYLTLASVVCRLKSHLMEPAGWLIIITAGSVLAAPLETAVCIHHFLFSLFPAFCCV